MRFQSNVQLVTIMDPPGWVEMTTEEERKKVKGDLEKEKVLLNLIGRVVNMAKAHNESLMEQMKTANNGAWNGTAW
jgi:hypothetical protein